MERITKFRAFMLLVLFCLVLAFFGLKLYDLQIIETGGSKDNVTTYTTMTRVKAARGDILDSNGNVLVSNRASYDLVFNHFVLLCSDSPNTHLLNLVKLCREMGIEYDDHFPVTPQRPFEYTLLEQSALWQGYFQDYLPTRGDLDSDISAPLLIKELRRSYLIPEEWNDDDARAVIGLRYELGLRQGITNLPNFVFMEDASDEALSAILELNIPGLNVEASTVREYNTTYAAHILGFVGPMNEAQWAKYSELGYSMDAEVGQDGLEAAFEEYLHGTDGWRVDEVTADGTVISSYYEVEPKAGNNVEITVDLNLQMAAEDKLAQVLEDLRDPEKNKSQDGRDAQGGAVVVMEVKTGKILACASYPTYDLSTFFENYDEILHGEYNPLINRALNASYPPGSTYKMSMVVAGIENKYIGPYYEILDEGIFNKYKKDDFVVQCLAVAYGYTHELCDSRRALAVSCNYYFYVLGDMMPIEPIDATAKGLGLGEPTGVELPESLGHRSNPETKRKLYTGTDAGFYSADKVLTAIGQSDNRFTPLQLCVYTCTLANQGVRYQATFLNRVVSADYRTLEVENLPKVMSTMEISDETYNAYITGMRMVITDNEGTSHTLFKDYPIEICAKTGTAQHDPTYTKSDHGAYVCFAPADDPQIAIVVYGEQAGHGTTLGNVAKAIFDVYFDVDEIGDVITYENQPG